MHNVIELYMSKRFMPSSRQTNVMYSNVTESDVH